MITTGISSAHYQIQKLIVSHGSKLSDQYPWVWEHDRWKELVFCLLTRISTKDHEELHLICDNLHTLGLLDISALAEIDHPNDQLSVLITDFLLQHEFSKKEADRAIVSMSEVANGLKKYYKGKIQEYLRSYGLLLLEDVPKKFQFTSLSNEDVEFAFTYWLQNVMNMPLSLKDPTLLEFSQSTGLHLDELLQAADDLGINTAILDDLVQMNSLTKK